jgi:hypothetical protein
MDVIQQWSQDGRAADAVWGYRHITAKGLPVFVENVCDRFWSKKALTRIVESFKGPSAFIQTEIGPGAANPGLFDLKYP